MLEYNTEYGFFKHDPNFQSHVLLSPLFRIMWFEFWKDRQLPHQKEQSGSPAAQTAGLGYMSLSYKMKTWSQGFVQGTGRDRKLVFTEHSLHPRHQAQFSYLTCPTLWRWRHCLRCMNKKTEAQESKIIGHVLRAGKWQELSFSVCSCTPHSFHFTTTASLFLFFLWSVLNKWKMPVSTLGCWNKPHFF